jgi:hypothetical protein
MKDVTSRILVDRVVLPSPSFCSDFEDDMLLNEFNESLAIIIDSSSLSSNLKSNFSLCDLSRHLEHKTDPILIIIIFNFNKRKMGNDGGSFAKR